MIRTERIGLDEPWQHGPPLIWDNCIWNSATSAERDALKRIEQEFGTTDEHKLTPMRTRYRPVDLQYKIVSYIEFLFGVLHAILKIAFQFFEFSITISEMWSFDMWIMAAISSRSSVLLGLVRLKNRPVWLGQVQIDTT